jgi:hypothetical protein
MENIRGGSDPPGPAIIKRIKAEFLEMPGLELTSKQAQRLYNLDPATWEMIAEHLIAKKVLRRTSKGNYARA